jgi:DNA-directed RNA polymerase specialized sigma24 family protein
VTEAAATVRQAGATSAPAEFERLYRANVEAVTAYFARRSAGPQVVADLTADTFVTAITSFGSFDPGRGTARAWVFGIARHVYAAHCEAYGQQRDRLRRLAGRRDLEPDQVEELLDRIDAERAGRDLVSGLACCRTGTARWSSLWTSPACARRRRRQCSGSRLARHGCG